MQRVEPEATEQSTWNRTTRRHVEPGEWRRFEQSMAEIFTAFGMDLDTPGTARHAGAVPAGALRRDRRLRGRPEAADGVPDRVPLRRGLPGQPDHRGADLLLLAVRAPRAAVPRLRARRLRRARADHRHLEADPARAAVRAPLHGAGASRRADRRRARRADRARTASPSISRRCTCARRCAASARSTRRRSRPSGAAATATTRSCGASSSPRSATATPGHERRERGKRCRPPGT